MPSPLTVKRNEYRKNPKRSDIYTPDTLSRFLFDILYQKQHIILDPAIGSGRLTRPWYDVGCLIHGVDTRRVSPKCHRILHKQYENCTKDDLDFYPDLVLMNPPFNQGTGRKLYPEVFLRKTFELFGSKIPVAMITPMGFLYNQRKISSRWKWLRDCGAQLTSTISLPLDIFPEVQFHCLVVIFNMTGLKSHYFLPEDVITNATT